MNSTIGVRVLIINVFSCNLIGRLVKGLRLIYKVRNMRTVRFLQ